MGNIRRIMRFTNISDRGLIKTLSKSPYFVNLDRFVHFTFRPTASPEVRLPELKLFINRKKSLLINLSIALRC